MFVVIRKKVRTATQAFKRSQSRGTELGLITIDPGPRGGVHIDLLCRKSRKRVLFISPVWPEPNSSAAGVRTATLMQTLHAANWEIFYLR